VEVGEEVNVRLSVSIWCTNLYKSYEIDECTIDGVKYLLSSAI
jgi:hypothetical protein